MFQSKLNTLVDKFIAADAYGRGRIINGFDQLAAEPDRDHFFFLFMRNELFQEGTSCGLYLVILPDSDRYIIYCLCGG